MSKTAKVAGIVMNANPFTYGHYALIDQAAHENDLVYVFVVNTDASLFRTTERVKLVQQGTAAFDNVVVVNGGDYMVSYATFPAYFLPSTTQTVTYQTTLDARLFRDEIAPALNITTRYLGAEPFSTTTATYNQVLQRELPPKVAVKIVERQTTQTSQQIITATQVRRAIAAHNLTGLDQLVPPTTLSFIKAHQADLTTRIDQGAKVAGN